MAWLSSITRIALTALCKLLLNSRHMLVVGPAESTVAVPCDDDFFLGAVGLLAINFAVSFVELACSGP